MNILQVLPELDVGGVESGTVDLAKRLVKLGHKAVVVSDGGELVNELSPCGAIHYKLGVKDKSLFTIIRMVPRLADIIKKEEIDIVHARSRVPAWIAYFACRRSNAVFITTCHGYYDIHFFSRVMGWGKRVIVVSNAIARHMIEDFGVFHDQIRLIPRCVDLDKFKFVKKERKRTKEFVVGIISRLTPIKGHPYFIRAMAKVIRSIPSLKVWIVGDASSSREYYKEELQVLVNRLGLSHCTQFLGTQRNIPEVLSKIDCLVLATTTQEAFGKTLIEAQASGVVVVATEVGGVVDVVKNEKTGLLVPAADADSIAEAVIRIYKNPDLADKLIENAYKNVKQKYNLDILVKNTLDVYKDALRNFTILIIKLSALGDIVLTTAALRAIRERFGDNYKISFLIGEESKDVLLRCPYIDELLVADLKQKDKGVKGMLKLSTTLRNKNFDMVIDLQNNRRSHLLSFLTLSRKRYGYKNNKFGFLLNYGIKDEKQNINPVEHQFKILKMLDIDLKDPHPKLWPSVDDESYIEEFLNSHWLGSNQKIIGMSLSGSARWVSKRWPVSHTVKLFEELDRKKLRVIITGSENDLEQARIIINLAKNVKIIDAVGKTTINQLACLIKKCDAFVSVDSSPLHIAAAVNTPFVALFGPTDPRRHLAPAQNCIVLRKGLACSPCYKASCKDKRCMDLITPDEVLEAVEKLL